MHTDFFCSFKGASCLSYFCTLLHVIQYTLISTLYAKKKRTTARLKHVGKQLPIEAIDSRRTSPPDVNAPTDYPIAEAVNPLWKKRESIVHKADHLYFIPVSYTHLRAHETPDHLLCRLLLKKKKKT